MRKSPDQLGRPGGAGAGVPASAALPEGIVGRRWWLVDADIMVSPGHFRGFDTDDLQSVTSTGPDNPGNFRWLWGTRPWRETRLGVGHALTALGMPRWACGQ